MTWPASTPTRPISFHLPSGMSSARSLFDITVLLECALAAPSPRQEIPHTWPPLALNMDMTLGGRRCSSFHDRFTDERVQVVLVEAVELAQLVPADAVGRNPGAHGALTDFQVCRRFCRAEQNLVEFGHARPPARRTNRAAARGPAVRPRPLELSSTETPVRGGAGSPKVAHRRVRCNCAVYVPEWRRLRPFGRPARLARQRHAP